MNGFQYDVYNSILDALGGDVNIPASVLLDELNDEYCNVLTMAFLNEVLNDTESELVMVEGIVLYKYDLPVQVTELPLVHDTVIEITVRL